MSCSCLIHVGTDDLASIVDSIRAGEQSSEDVNPREHATIQKKPVLRRPIEIETDDLTSVVNPDSAAESRTRNVDRCESAPFEKKTASQTSRVDVRPDDLTSVVHLERQRQAGARDIDSRKDSMVLEETVCVS